MNIIFFIHTLFLLWILVVPFTNDKRQLQFYSMTVPFLFYHWSVNDDTCALTQAEVYMTGQNKDKTFMGRLVGPIYKMPDTAANNLTKTVFFLLWAFVQYRLGHFDSFIEDLRKILKSKKV